MTGDRTDLIEPVERRGSAIELARPNDGEGGEEAMVDDWLGGDRGKTQRWKRKGPAIDEKRLNVGRGRVVGRAMEMGGTQDG